MSSHLTSPHLPKLQCPAFLRHLHTTFNPQPRTHVPFTVAIRYRQLRAPSAGDGTAALPVDARARISQLFPGLAYSASIERRHCIWKLSSCRSGQQARRRYCRVTCNASSGEAVSLVARPCISRHPSWPYLLPPGNSEEQELPSQGPGSSGNHRYLREGRHMYSPTYITCRAVFRFLAGDGAEHWQTWRVIIVLHWSF